MKTFYREVGQHCIQYKITYMVVYNNLGISGVQRTFLTWCTDYTEKGYTVPTEFRDHFDQSRSVITEPIKMDQSEKRNLKPKFTTLKLLCSSPQSPRKSATSLDSVTRE